MADKHAPWYNGKIADPSHAVLAWQQLSDIFLYNNCWLTKKLLEKSY